MSSRDNARPVVRFREARRAGAVQRGPGDLWVNRSPDLILVLPGEEVDSLATCGHAARACLIPAHGEAQVTLTAASVRQCPERSAAYATPMPGQCGAAHFVAGVLTSVAVMRAPEDYLAYLERPTVKPITTDPVCGDDPPAPLKRTRQLFDQCVYAVVRTRWRAGALSIIDLHAPRVTGWGALAENELLALELRPRAEVASEMWAD